MLFQKINLHNFFIFNLFTFLACGAGGDFSERKTEKTPVQPNAQVSAIAANDTFTLDYMMGKFVPASHPHFAEIPLRYASERGMYLRREVVEAFAKMASAAASEGMVLRVVSATRNFERQKKIWEDKWTGVRQVDGMDLSKSIANPAQRATKILEYSSMPGTSRHHWGTDLDINTVEPEYFDTEQGRKIYDWLVLNGNRFGFCQPYTPKGNARPAGYNEEKWHWSYRPTSARLLRLAKDSLRDDMIAGFQGAGTAVELKVVERYVLGVNQECQR